MEIQDTSIEARDFLQTSGLGKKYRKQIFYHIYEHGGKTCDEIEQELSMRHQTASSQIRWLVQNEFLMKSKEKRRTRTGRNAIVWVVFKPDKKQMEFDYA